MRLRVALAMTSRCGSLEHSSRRSVGEVLWDAPSLAVANRGENLRLFLLQVGMEFQAIFRGWTKRVALRSADLGNCRVAALVFASRGGNPRLFRVSKGWVSLKDVPMCLGWCNSDVEICGNYARVTREAQYQSRHIRRLC